MKSPWDKTILKYDDRLCNCDICGKQVRMEKKEIRKKSNSLDPVVRVGKQGITESLISEVRLQLKKNKLIKIKLLRSFVDENDKKEAMRCLADKTGCDYSEIIGFCIVLYKK